MKTIEEIVDELVDTETVQEETQILKEWANSIIDKCIEICKSQDDSNEMEQLKDQL